MMLRGMLLAVCVLGAAASTHTVMCPGMEEGDRYCDCKGNCGDGSGFCLCDAAAKCCADGGGAGGAASAGTTTAAAPAAPATTPAPTTAPTTVADVIPASDRAKSPKVELKLGFATELTPAEETNVKNGIAAAAKAPADNVDLKKDARRTVTYTATVYVKDAASATAVKGNLGEAAVKSALVASGAPAPTTVSAPVEKAADESNSAVGFFTPISQMTSLLAAIVLAAVTSMCVA